MADREAERAPTELHEGRSRRRWRIPSDAVLCTSVAIGSPMDVHLVGGHLLGDVGPVAGVIALFAGAAFWLFRRYGDTACSDPEISPESDLIWAELDAYEAEAPVDPVEL